ncbi:terminase large subunit domain-containing protein [Erythrobacter sp. LQ02-29]|uniref:terminase large subunit domain-containing protein n=1 Tax=Erythrobacter sp. LQ02-29 TaxID=2920384 RepID=UPI00358FCC47
MVEMADARGRYLGRIRRGRRADFVQDMSQDERLAFDKHWELQAHDGQIAPPGEWSTWLLMAGRGFGKTRAGAEWTRAVAQADGTARIALVGASLAEARAIMVEGPSGLLAVAGKKQRPRFEPSKNLLRWPGGAEARLYSAAEPESLRGPQHSHASRTGAEGVLRQRSAGAARCAHRARCRGGSRHATRRPGRR